MKFFALLGLTVAHPVHQHAVAPVQVPVPVPVPVFYPPVAPPAPPVPVKPVPAKPKGLFGEGPIWPFNFYSHENKDKNKGK